MFHPRITVINAVLLLLVLRGRASAGEVILTPQAMAQLESANTTILIQTNLTLDRSRTVPATSSLRFSRGGMITVPAGRTLRVLGGIEAGLQQIFAGPGAVKGNPQVQDIYPQWFYGGASADTTADWAAAFQKAIRLVPEGGGTVRVPRCEPVYMIRRTVYIPCAPWDSLTRKVVNIIGDPVDAAGKGHGADTLASHIHFTSRVGFRINSRNDSTAILPGGAWYTSFTLKDLRLFGTNRTPKGGQTAIYALNFGHCAFENLLLHWFRNGIDSAPVRGSYNEFMILRNVHFDYIADTCFDGGGFNDGLLIENCYIDGDSEYTTDTGFRIVEASGVNIVGGIYDWVHTAFRFFRGNGVHVSGIYSESLLPKRTEKGEEKGAVFEFCNTAGVEVGQSFFALGPEGKLARFEGASFTGISFSGNRILLHEKDASGTIFDPAGPDAAACLAGSISFTGNSVVQGAAAMDVHRRPDVDLENEYPHFRVYEPTKNTSMERPGYLEVPKGDTARRTLFADDRWSGGMAKVTVYADSRYAAYYQEFLLLLQDSGGPEPVWTVQPITARTGSTAQTDPRRRLTYDWDLACSGRTLTIALSHWGGAGAGPAKVWWQVDGLH